MARNYPAANHLLFADDTVFFCKSDSVSCDSFLAILKKYEAASDQRINRQKLTITFSSKTPVAIRIKVKERLHIEAEGGIDEYLGLPENFSRRKRDIFANIVDRIRQRSHSWSSKYLNGTGKQVLLKAVLTALPCDVVLQAATFSLQTNSVGLDAILVGCETRTEKDELSVLEDSYES